MTSSTAIEVRSTSCRSQITYDALSHQVAGDPYDGRLLGQMRDDRAMPSSLDITFRVATAADAVRLSAFAEGVYRATFSASNSSEDMDIYCASAFGPDIQRRELMEPTISTLIAENTNALVAYAQLCDVASDERVAGTRPVELRRFYGAPHYQGTALARELMMRVVQLALDGGHDVLWLGVWERNARAIRFYEKCGFHAVGDHVFQMGNDPQAGSGHVVAHRPGSS